MRIAITGSSGLIGSALVDVLCADGHEVVRLVRREARGRDEVRWNPTADQLDPASLGRLDAAVNLAGAAAAGRPWTSSYKRVMEESRLASTRTLVRALTALDSPPGVLLSASAVGYYGFPTEPGQEMDEGDGPGGGFLAHMCASWEAAAVRAEDAGIRVCLLRSGVVLSRRGGALSALLPLFRLGLGGRIGSGEQRWSWIALADEIRAIRFMLRRETVRGPVNLTAPTPVSNAEFTRALGEELHRPTPVPVPAFAMRAVFRDWADQVVRTQVVRPDRLLEAGFTFRYPDIMGAIGAALSD